MKKTTMKMMAALACFALMITAVSVLGTLMIGAEQGTADTSIRFPALPSINAAYPDTSTFGIDMDAIDAQFPKELEISYADGVISIKNLGADEARMNSNNEYYTLTLADGYWTAEVPDRSDDYQAGEVEFFWFTCISSDGSGTRISVNYVNGTKDSYVTLEKPDGANVSINAEHDTMTVQYNRDEYYVEDRYENGILDYHQVSVYEGGLADLECLNYNADGSVAFATVYADTYYYYFPDLGWSSDWYEYVSSACPEGYEGLDETYFTDRIPSFFYCGHAETSQATCSEDGICSACGEITEKAKGHVWGAYGTEQMGTCTVCSTPRMPKFEFFSGVYENLAESGFPYREIRSLFSTEIEILYENGKYMAKDIGVYSAKIYTSVDYQRSEMTYENGYWVYALDEQLYSDPGVDVCIEFFGEDALWQVLYKNGEVFGSLQLSHFSEHDDNVILIYLTMDLVEVLYNVGDRYYRDTYQGDMLVKQMIDVNAGEHRINATYDAQKSLSSFSVDVNDGNCYYYHPGEGWSLNVNTYSPESACAAPAGYENFSMNELADLAPCTIGCAHEAYSEADCENPEKCMLCGRAKEGSVALGHDIVIDQAKAPTCTEDGLTQGEHCSGCDHATVEQESVPMLGHDWADATTQAPMTCRACGETEGEPLPPAATEPDVTEPDVAEPENHGCKAALVLSAVMPVAAIGAALALKKKKEQ